MHSSDIQNEIEDIKSRMQYDNTLPNSGWTNIIVSCHKKLKMLDPNYKIIQIKEKFGSLRFYFQTKIEEKATIEAMHRYVSIAEKDSANTCEVCGGESRIEKTKSGWYKAFCKNCLLKEES